MAFIAREKLQNFLFISSVANIRDDVNIGLLGSNYFTNNALRQRVAWLQPHLETPSRQEHSQNSWRALFKQRVHGTRRERES
jgi:hypothetical protein